MPFRHCFLAIVFVLSLMSYADACPGCRNVNEKDKHLPMAYQTSILFMLSVPMSLIGGIVFRVVPTESGPGSSGQRSLKVVRFGTGPRKSPRTILAAYQSAPQPPDSSAIQFMSGPERVPLTLTGACGITPLRGSHCLPVRFHADHRAVTAIPRQAVVRSGIPN